MGVRSLVWKWSYIHIRVISLVVGMLVVSTSLAQSLVLGVHPYRPHAELIKMFSPLAKFLTQETGKLVEVRVGESYESHFKAIVQGKVDFAFLGPAVYVQLTRENEIPQLLARLEINGRPTFTGRIISREGSGVKTIDDLRHSHFAFGNPSSTMSHLVPRQMLFEAGIDVSDFAGHQFYSNHNNVALAILAGDADAGAVKEAVYEKYRPLGIVSIASTPEISEHLFISPVKTDPIKVASLRRHLLSLTADNPITRQVLGPIKKTATALVEVKNKDYHKLRGILAALRDRGVLE
ncbi:MAG: phosphate/phosphite/phosphonate ABC transporter substrate-binding protein [Candidatus Thiodiazotropha sp. (ex Monitilora ramsayi)]|nr:phosphate/phosphite/phosphonate ABC transporter substrate-binding protein [Candidatus Thiodiazotropha sp. (ex Monitilora ramsayi)]